MTIIPLHKVATTYPDLAALSVIFNHEVVEMNDVWRWKPNKLMNYLSDTFPTFSGSRTKIDLNQLQIDLLKGKFTVEEKMKYSMQTGYSLGGFCELFGQHEASEFKLPGAKTKHSEGQNKDDYVETVIEYMLRIHQGTVLKL